MDMLQSLGMSKDLIADLLINIVSIIVLYLVVKKLAYNPVKKFLNARTEKVEAQKLEAAENLKEANEMKEKYDVIIIGSGPAGISASLYTARANLKTLIISKGIGILEKVKKIENYYGLDEPLTGEELHEIGKKKKKKLGVDFAKDEVVKIEYEENDK